MYEDAVDPVTASSQRSLRFVTCEVVHVDEGRTRNGAELQLHYGVDGASQTFRIARVHDGEQIALPEARCPLDPGLDGEVWFWGLEEDLGDSPIDRDDPLPWALDRLPRDGVDFRPGPGALEVRREVRSADGTRLVIRYVVEEA